MKSSEQMGPSAAGTLAILLSCGIGYFLSMEDGLSSEMLRKVSIALLAGIGISYLLDWRSGLRNLIRVDVFALLAFFFLTFFEFLFPQGHFDTLVIREDVTEATQLLIMGLAAMVIGRHLSLFPKATLAKVGEVEMNPGDFLLIFFGATFFSFLPQLMAVDFNPLTWFEETLKTRFGRAWARGKYGSLETLLYELQLLGYVMPPIAGLIFARRKQYNTGILLLVGLALLLLWYEAFASGTRNILAVKIAGFFAGFFVIQRELKLIFIIPTVLCVGVSFVVLADHMLSFRNMGLGRYVEGEFYKEDYQELNDSYLGGGFEEDADEKGYMVDYNVWRFSQLVSAFPENYDFIGINMPYVALTKPIPRALWPGKPMGLKVGLEEAVGVEGMTIAVTWVGEAFIAGGWVWIVGIGLAIGAFCGWWNHLARYITTPFALIVFASGFYAVLLLMRSLMFFTTALLPSIALIVMGLVLYKQRQGP